MNRQHLLELAKHHENECSLHTSKSGRCATRRCLVRGGWNPKVLGDSYHLATCEAHETATALRELAASRPRGWDEGEHEGCGVDSERAVKAQGNTQ